MKQDLELLAPAGSFEIVKAVIRAGADAVYLGGALFGARAYANNLSVTELLNAIDYAHIHGRKVFLTVNTLLKNNEITTKLYDYLLPYYQAGLDAVIVQDFGVLQFIRQCFPDLPIHASTQMTITGVDGAKLLKEAGAERIVTARELSLAEIKAIHDNVDVEIESFVHGALCYCYSGGCLLSSMLGGRSGNRGRCAQPCRLPYTVLNEKGQVQNQNAPFILSLKDLNTIEFLPQIAQSGVSSFKIEGRMKSLQYAAGVVSVYRHYMDQYLCSDYQVRADDLQKLYDFGNRSGFTDGYYHQWNGPQMLTGESSTHSKASEKEVAHLVAEFTEKELQEKINGKLTLFKGSHAMMQVNDKLGNEIEVTGDVVQTAIKSPMSRENILAKVQQTGNTPFVFDKLELQMEDDIFIPVAALKNMRQEALASLLEKRLAPFHRDGQQPYQMPAESHLRQAPENTAVSELIVSTESHEAITLASQNPYVSTIYLDSILYSNSNLVDMLRADVDVCKQHGKQVFFMMPAIFRKKTRDFYLQMMPKINELPLDGYVVKNYDELGFLKTAGSGESFIPALGGKEIRADHSLYTYSNQASQAFAEMDVERTTMPLELNGKELRHRDNHNSEMMIYGYLPLMVSAGCVYKNTESGKCNQKSSLLYLKDRYEVQFPVINNCNDCYNILYNAKPLFLLHLAKDMEPLQPAAVRIHFTLENRDQIASILQAYERAFIGHEQLNAEEWVKDYTNGHYKRGVE